MRRIRYLQGEATVANLGSGAAALELPQDETTAAVRIGAILARNYGELMPGEYRAVIEDPTGTSDRPSDNGVQDGTGDGGYAVVVGEDDPRVARARDLLAGIAKGRDYTAAELGAVRQALLGGEVA
ncbi:MAG: hypothetical protein ACRDVE_20905 [Actinocrinis sp.]